MCLLVCLIFYPSAGLLCYGCVSFVMCVAETPPPGYISEDGETSDHQMNRSMDTGDAAYRQFITQCG